MQLPASTRAARRSPTAGPTAPTRAPSAAAPTTRATAPLRLRSRSATTPQHLSRASRRAGPPTRTAGTTTRCGSRGRDPTRPRGSTPARRCCTAAPTPARSRAPADAPTRRATPPRRPTFRFHYDATAPGGLGVAPARPPDHDGWYNHPLAIRWFASDVLAGIASCTSLTYGGPDETGGRLTGVCADRAGNRSATLPFALRYDEDAPSLAALSLKGLDDAVALRWRATGASELQITRSTGSGSTSSRDVYSGTGSAFTDRNVENYVRYRYTLTAEDPAGNTVQRTASVMPLPVLYAPRGGAHLRRACEAAVRLEAREESALLQLPALGGRPPGW